MTSLYKISEELNIIISQIEADGGEINIDQELLLSQLQDQLVRKTDGVVEFVKKRKDRLDAMSTRIKELQSMKASESASLERFENYCRNCMKLLNVSEIEGSYGFIKTRKKPPSVTILDDNKIPAKYKIVVQDTKIDKKLIAADLKSGEKVDGAELIRNPCSLVFGG